MEKDASAGKKKAAAAPAKKGKQARVWGDNPSGKEGAEALDFTDGTAGEAAIAVDSLAQRSLIDVEEEVSYEDELAEVRGGRGGGRVASEAC